MSDRTLDPARTRKTGRLAGADFITAILLMAFGAAMFAGALKMRMYQTFFISPGFFPMILGILFAFFGLVLLYTSSRRGGWPDARRILSSGNLGRSLASPVLKKGSVVFLLILAYVALLGTIDFLYLTMGYLFFTFFFLKAAKWYWIIVISIVGAVIIHVVFRYFFRIPMP
ncbi:MAG: tripartite tricarboxylate transporter TctB family protein [Synergistaceae bacterium]|nr:tripartite tricarboxylate transporter TctB family protein [Synergistaceae bacterium]